MARCVGGDGHVLVLWGRNPVPVLGRCTEGAAGSGVWTASSSRKEGGGSVLRIDNCGAPWRGLIVDASREGCGGGQGWMDRAEVIRASGGCGGQGGLGRPNVIRRNKLVMQGLRLPIKSKKILSKAVDT